ncbi:pantoate--beta-alanine ligase [Acidiphilium sp. PA]|uniref:pantoate--beta-alanine ligase n=1 Tax=Acidiphilium sp. PA TaxID=2871705 RepID=UPI002244D71C|nr:pantoate--beta-alanine ligase [Acidiphilium sp. PA]MCW8307259.1 pantoate--beta-alanine ligase [Acidiphilium sp. PA]
MEIARTPAQLRAARAAFAAAGRPRLALVPTMGALHEGHLSLIRVARAHGDVVAASIFVNPTQFAPGEDFARYPRDEAADCAMLAAAGCDLVWLPDVTTMYPPGDATIIDVAGPALLWEGVARPGHFRGVATVVAKLFGQVRPDAACFGEKDWQQVQVIRRMVDDLGLPVAVVAAPTWREANGLAMSSRNRYLAAAERAAAPALFAALTGTRDAICAGAPVRQCVAAGEAALVAAGFTVDYLALVDAQTLEPLSDRVGAARLIAAARLGTTRLLDNIAV